MSGFPPFPDNVPTAPLVTLSLVKLLASDPSEVEAFFKAARELGFFYLDMRGAPEGEALLAGAEALFKVQKETFDLPLEEKAKYDQMITKDYFGYKGLGASVIDKKGTLDRNEVYNVAKDDILGVTPPRIAPEPIVGNRALYESYIRNCLNVFSAMYSHLDAKLRLPPGTLASLHRPMEESGDHVRFVMAPPQPVDDSRASLGAHTDFGSLTILFCWLGALQLQMPGSTDWVYVRPVPGCAVINLGDAMVKFTAGILRSNIHRVVNPPGPQADETTYILVYFSRPEDTVVLKRLTCGDGKGGKSLIDEQPVPETPEDEVTSKQWILRRGLGNRVGVFKGPEDWEKNRGTEGERE